MLNWIIDEPRFLASDRFVRRVKTMEYEDRADLQRILLSLLAQPDSGSRNAQGSYELVFGRYALRYSLLDERDPQTRVSLDDLKLA